MARGARCGGASNQGAYQVGDFETPLAIFERTPFGMRTQPLCPPPPIWGSCLNRACTMQTFCFCSLVYRDVISKPFWLCICGLLVCFCEGRSTR